MLIMLAVTVLVLLLVAVGVYALCSAAAEGDRQFDEWRDEMPPVEDRRAQWNRPWGRW